MKYLPWFELHLTHPYYTHGRCLDFDIQPSRRTEQVLKNQRAQVKALPDGFRVLLQVTNSGQAFIPLLDGTAFNFQLRLRNSNFTTYTDLSNFERPWAYIYRNENTNSATTLSLKKRQNYTTEAFQVQKPDPSESFTLRANPIPTIQITDFNIEGLNDISHPHNFKGQTKQMQIDTSLAQANDPFQVDYPIITKSVTGTFAELEIHYDQRWPNINTGVQIFEIAFQAKTRRWAFYVITDHQQASLQIDDTDSAGLSFSQANQRNLSTNPDPEDRVAQMLGKQFPNLRILRFLSDTEILCEETARSSLRLMLDTEAIIQTLPNPKPTQINLLKTGPDGNTQAESVLYQVIKYFKH